MAVLHLSYRTGKRCTEISSKSFFMTMTKLSPSGPAMANHSGRCIACLRLVVQTADRAIQLAMDPLDGGLVQDV